MDDNLKLASKFDLRRSIGKQAVLIAICLLTAFVFMPRFHGAISFELWVWLSLFWYLGLALLWELIALRGRCRINTLLIFITGFAVVMMFPFSGIRKAHFRAKYSHLGEKEKSQTHVLGYWTAWGVSEIPGGIIPNCLIWRVPKAGLFRVNKITCTLEALESLPDWYVREASELNIQVSSNDRKLGSAARTNRKHPAVPIKVRIGKEGEIFDLNRSEIQHVDANRIANLINFRHCRKLEINCVDFSEEGWEKLLAHEQLLDIAISNSNISDRGLSSLNHGISHLSLVGNTHLSRKAVYSAIVQSHRLFTLALGDNYLSKELELVLDKPPNLSGLEIYPDDDRIEIDGDISINRRIGLTMIGYRFSFLSNPSLQKSLSTARFLSIVKCRLVSSDLAALSKSPSPEWILIRSCAISKREVLEFGKWLVDHEVVADQPFSSNCNATELNTFFIWSLPQWRVRIDDTTTIESGDPQGGLSPAEMHD